MAKNDKTEKGLNKIRLILGIIIAVFAISGSIWAIVNYFAKSKDMDLISRRLDISIIDDQIFQKEQNIQNKENLIIFKREDKELTEMEKKILEEERKELKGLKEKKERKIEQYEQRQMAF